MKLHQVQALLAKYHIPGWLLYDFRRSNPLACRLLSIPKEELLTRRFFYWIPQVGTPVKIVSAVENPLTHLPGQETLFHSYHALIGILKTVLKGIKKIAMEYAPLGMTPDISLVDGGTLELIRSFGMEVVSSGDLLQELMCVWDEGKWQSHQYAARTLEEIVQAIWKRLGKEIKAGKTPTEYEVQQWMLQMMQEKNCISDNPPICAVNAHSANPHYEPRKEGSAPIQAKDFVLIDLWCRENKENTVYADITRVGIIGREPNSKEQKIFELVQLAQKAAFEYVEKSYLAKIPIHGNEVDQVSRTLIEDAGYGPFFVHRTGHNIDLTDHGPGAHLDSLETHEIRRLLPGTCFSIEPGIYLPNEFGVRLEYDVFLHPEGKAIITGGAQEKIENIPT